MKYIVVDFSGMELPILFSEALPHKFVAGAKPVVSAGFWVQDDGVWEAKGGSDGLHLRSRPQDTKLIEQSLRFTTFVDIDRMNLALLAQLEAQPQHSTTPALHA